MDSYDRTFLRDLKIEVLRVYNTIRREGDTKWKLGDYRSGDEAPQYLLSRLPPRYSGVPPSLIRRMVHSISGRLDAPLRQGDKRTGVKKLRDAAENGLRELSPEYKEYIDSDIWKSRANRHRHDVEWHCQVCGKEHGTALTLHVHHNTYAALDGREKAWMLIAVCASPCHPICDYLRQEAAFMVECQESDLFDPHRDGWVGKDGLP